MTLATAGLILTGKSKTLALAEIKPIRKIFLTSRGYCKDYQVVKSYRQNGLAACLCTL